MAAKRPLSSAARSVGDSVTLKLNAKAARMRAAGDPVVHLGGGEPKNNPRLRKAIDEGGESSRVALSMLREEKRDKERKNAAGLVLAGAITAAAGVAVMPVFWFMVPVRPVWPVGLVPLAVGIVLILWGRYSLKSLTGDG